MQREYSVGEELPTVQFTVEGSSMKVFSMIMKDPNPIHFDVEAVRALGLGDRPVNQGTINMAYPINALLDMVESPSQLRRFRCRFLGSLFAGDLVTVAGIVTASRAEEFEVDIWLDRDDTRVLTGSAVLSRF
jgi:acyl dehydratase